MDIFYYREKGLVRTIKERKVRVNGTLSVVFSQRPNTERTVHFMLRFHFMTVSNKTEEVVN